MRTKGALICFMLAMIRILLGASPAISGQPEIASEQLKVAFVEFSSSCMEKALVGDRAGVNALIDGVNIAWAKARAAGSDMARPAPPEAAAYKALSDKANGLCANVGNVVWLSRDFPVSPDGAVPSETLMRAAYSAIASVRYESARMAGTQAEATFSAAYEGARTFLQSLGDYPKKMALGAPECFGPFRTEQGCAVRRAKGGGVQGATAGKLAWPNAASYEGGIKAGHPEGKGVLTLPPGGQVATIEGTFAGGVADGPAEVLLADGGARCVGNMRAGEMDGPWRCKRTDGIAWLAEMKDGALAPAAEPAAAPIPPPADLLQRIAAAKAFASSPSADPKDPTATPPARTGLSETFAAMRDAKHFLASDAVKAFPDAAAEASSLLEMADRLARWRDEAPACYLAASDPPKFVQGDCSAQQEKSSVRNESWPNGFRYAGPTAMAAPEGAEGVLWFPEGSLAVSLTAAFHAGVPFGRAKAELRGGAVCSGELTAAGMPAGPWKCKSAGKETDAPAKGGGIEVKDGKSRKIIILTPGAEAKKR